MLKLINAGLGRTGTTSLKVALEKLGFGPCYHMFDIVNDDRRLGQWEKIVCEAQRPDWEAVFDGYTSAVDGPSAIYYRQLMEAFPQAKIMLTVRAAERWYQSTYDTLYQFAVHGGADSSDTSSMRSRVHRLTSTMTWNGLFGGRFPDRDHAIDVFHRHNQEVISTVGPDNLLIYDVKDGWGPLCAFLGVEVPAEQFPHVNDTESMRRRLRQMVGGAGPVAPDRAAEVA
ncbi:MAG: sulfotransferase family protein [Gaiellaceae bacterium]